MLQSGDTGTLITYDGAYGTKTPSPMGQTRR
jgi:hypothetical protein